MRVPRFSKFEENGLRARLNELYRRKSAKEWDEDPTIYDHEIRSIESALKVE